MDAVECIEYQLFLLVGLEVPPTKFGDHTADKGETLLHYFLRTAIGLVSRRLQNKDGGVVHKYGLFEYLSRSLLERLGCDVAE